jgi:hypothetical protein
MGGEEDHVTNEIIPDPEEASVIGRVCHVCGHAEDEHVEQDAEVAGNTIRRTYCQRCDDWHEFVLEP